MFQKGTVPFMGDYIDVAAAPAFIPDANGKWIYNTEPAVCLRCSTRPGPTTATCGRRPTRNAAGKLDDDTPRR